MLLKFTTQNYLSFKEQVSLNLQAASIKDYPESVYVSTKNNHKLLKSIGIFGHNSSGKTNIIKGISFMKEFVLSSSKDSITNKEIPIQVFKLSTITEAKPTTFEIVFLIDNIKYRYGFNVTTKAIHSEWLFATEKQKEEKYFIRANSEYSFEKKFQSSLRGKYELITEMIKSNSLLLSVLAQFNHKIALSITNWFSKILIVKDIEHLSLIDFTARLMSTSNYKKLINDVIKKADLGIDNIEEKAKELLSNGNYYELMTDFLKNDLRQFEVQTGHYKYKENNTIESKVYFDLVLNESFGTQKFFGILGPLLYGIKEQGIIFIDEIDARLHTLLFKIVIELYNSNKTNSNGGQLIFTAHNLHMLKKGLRRDQMVFVEKDQFGASTINSLNIKKPEIRNDASFDKDYLSGKYGAIHGLNSQLNLFEDSL